MNRGAGIHDSSAGLVSVCVAFDAEASFDLPNPNGRDARILLATADARLELNERADVAVLTLPPRSAAVVRVR
jgi:hypothetical protein